MTDAEIQRAVDAVWRLESARIIAGLARLTGDLGLAEDLAQDALVAALSQWPGSGLPPNPGAWLMSTARHRAIDRLRRDQRLRRNLGQLGHELHTRQQADVFGGPADFAAALDAGEVQDDLLRLMFVACHPVLSADARVALTLRLLGGLTTDEIARAFLVAEPTIAQRIVRAKRTLARKQVPFEVPSAGQRPARLASVLEAIYLIFNEGYTATAGEDWARPELCYEALRLGRMLAELSPDEPEVHGLAGLMEIQSSRLPAGPAPAASPSRCSNRTAAGGTGCSSGAASPRCCALSGSAARPGRTWCRRPSRPATPRPPRRPAPTGRGSRRCTRRWRRSRPARWPSSTARSRWAWPTGRPAGWNWPTGWPPGRSCAATTCCPACAVTCWPSWAATMRRGPSSSGRPRSPATPRSAPCCCAVRLNAVLLRPAAAASHDHVTGPGVCLQRE